ncbi:MAG: hypothetical protein ACLR56_14250 [Oscillospiraceae bacterium]
MTTTTAEAKGRGAFKYAEETGAKVLVYRFPNLFGKWCRPNCWARSGNLLSTANDLPITVNDRNTELSCIHR